MEAFTALLNNQMISEKPVILVMTSALAGTGNTVPLVRQLKAANFRLPIIAVGHTTAETDELMKAGCTHRADQGTPELIALIKSLLPKTSKAENDG
jgi:hypothetical protein